MKKNIVFCGIILIVSIIFAEDSTKTKSKYLSGLRISLHLQEKFLQEVAKSLNGAEGNPELSMGLQGPSMPVGIDIDLHCGRPQDERLKFPAGYSYMRCTNDGKDSDTFLRIHRHIIYGGVLYYFNDFTVGNFIPYINANLGYFIYGFHLKWKTNDPEFEDVNQFVGGSLSDGLSYYLSGGVAYSLGDGIGLDVEVVFNGHINCFTFSAGFIGIL